jgi:hypothetical protein
VGSPASRGSTLREAGMAEKKSFLLRISPDIYNALAAWAADDFRSLNGQIEFLLRQSLAQAGRLSRKGEQDR